MDKHYVIITWPEVQDWMEEPEFKNNSYLINDEKGIEEFGSSAYFVDIEWMNKIQLHYADISELVIDLINKKSVLVPTEDTNDFLMVCGQHGVTPCGGALDFENDKPTGQYFYLDQYVSKGLRH